MYQIPGVENGLTDVHAFSKNTKKAKTTTLGKENVLICLSHFSVLVENTRFTVRGIFETHIIFLLRTLRIGSKTYGEVCFGSKIQGKNTERDVSICKLIDACERESGPHSSAYCLPA